MSDDRKPPKIGRLRIEQSLHSVMGPRPIPRPAQGTKPKEGMSRTAGAADKPKPRPKDK